MNGHKQISPFLAGNLGTSAQRNEIIAGTHQFATEALLLAELALQLAGNGQGYMLLIDFFVRADGPGVLAAMAGIDGDDDVALATRRRRQARRRLRRRDGQAGLHGGQVTRRFAIKQIDDQAMPVLLIGLQCEALRRNPRTEVKHHAQLTGRALRSAHGADRRITQIELFKGHLQLRTTDINDDAFGCSQGEYAVFHRTTQVKHQACVVRRTPQAHTADIRGSQH